MSLPATGRYNATAGDLRLTFDGRTWSGTGDGFEEFILPALVRETARQSATHLTVDVVARRVLDKFFPGAWTETGKKTDQWIDPLPKEAVD